MIFTDAAIFECVYEEVLTMAIKKNSEEIYTDATLTCSLLQTLGHFFL